MYILTYLSYLSLLPMWYLWTPGTKCDLKYVSERKNPHLGASELSFNVLLDVCPNRGLQDASIKLTPDLLSLFNNERDRKRGN